MEILTTIFGLVVIFLWAELHEAIRTRNFKDFGLIHIKLFRDILIDKDGREKLNKKREEILIRKGLIKDPPRKIEISQTIRISREKRSNKKVEFGNCLEVLEASPPTDNFP